MPLSLLRTSHPAALPDGGPLPERAERAIWEGRTARRRDIDYALTQLENAMKKLSKEGLASDVERIEFIIPKGAPLKNENKIVKNGYLVDALTGKRIKLEGFRNLVMVIQL